MSNKEYAHIKYMHIYKPIWIQQDKLFMHDSVALQVFLQQQKDLLFLLKSLVYAREGSHSPLHSTTKSIVEQLPHTKLILL